MRFLDIAVAALIGASAITGMAAWSPQAGDSASRGAAAQGQLRDELLSFLSEPGMAWLIINSPSAACSALSGLSNSTVGVSASFGSYSCGSPPTAGSRAASLTLLLGTNDVDLEAWSSAPG